MSVALKRRQGSRQIRCPRDQPTSRSLQPLKQALWNLYPKPQREAGTFLAAGFHYPEGITDPQGALGSCQAPSCQWNHIYFCSSGWWCLSGRARLRSAPEKTSPTQFPVSGRFISNEFHSNIPVLRPRTEGRGHEALSQVGTKERGHTISTCHSPLSS